MTHRGALVGTLLFVLVGPLLEAGVGPFVLTGGFEVGDDLPGGPLRVLGGVLVALGLAVLAACLADFARRGRGTPSPAAPPGRLLISGPYRFVRHPMYVATATVIAGEGLLLRQPILLVGAAAYLGALSCLAHYREEPRLRARFGAAYAAYAAAVPAFVPRLRPPPAGTDAAG